MNEYQKQRIVQAIEREERRLGSANRVANKCGVSPATISQMKNRKWHLIREGMWQKVAAGLGVDYSQWNVAPGITNTRMLFQVFNDAKKERLFMAVSHKAGSGKTEAARQYASARVTDDVFYTQAREWAKREFLLNAVKTFGMEPPRGAVSVDELGQKVIEFFNERAGRSPLWIIDEADKLKPSALRFLIAFYNQLEDKVGMVILGTDNLRAEIERGVRLNRKGYDEIASRFGRNFISLIGATAADVKAICEANGITGKAKHKAIFEEAKPVRVKVDTDEGPVFLRVVEDLRRVKRIVKRELLKREEKTAALA